MAVVLKMFVSFLNVTHQRVLNALDQWQKLILNLEQIC